MKMIEIVNIIQSKGYNVVYHVRSDGGILVRRIDGETFPSGASGNARARQLAGATLSEAREKQLKYATRQRRIRKPSLDSDVEKEYLRVKRKWNRAFKAKGGKAHPAGYFGITRIKYAYEHYGREEALRRIHEAERYASGIAYSKNVEALAGLILDGANKFGSNELRKLAEDLIQNAYAIREEWIKPAYDELYKLNAGTPPADVARTTRSILRL